MNASEKTKSIIEQKYYNDIFDAISNYLHENPDKYWYDGDYCYDYWYELELRDYKLLELFYVMDQGNKKMEIVVQANIEVFDMLDIGMNRNINKKLRIGANVDSKYDNFEILYIGHLPPEW